MKNTSLGGGGPPSFSAMILSATVERVVWHLSCDSTLWLQMEKTGFLPPSEWLSPWGLSQSWESWVGKWTEGPGPRSCWFPTFASLLRWVSMVDGRVLSSPYLITTQWTVSQFVWRETHSWHSLPLAHFSSATTEVRVQSPSLLRQLHQHFSTLEEDRASCWSMADSFLPGALNSLEVLQVPSLRPAESPSPFF